MKSPFTGGEVILIKEPRTLEFRKASFSVIHHSYKCVDTCEQFTDTKLDELNINQVYNQYREKEGIPFPDEIAAFLDQYDLSAAKMSLILGFGINMYAKYVAGEMPNLSNGRMINICKDPRIFKSYFQNVLHQFSSKDKEVILKKIEKAELHHQEHTTEEFEKLAAMGHNLRGMYTGFVAPNLEKARQMVVYFATNCEPFTTKMNKLLFYSDFLNYGRTGKSITGMVYQAIPKGPVPQRYDGLFYNVSDLVERVDVFYPNDVAGERFTTDHVFNASLFTDDELKTLEKVVERFKNTSTNDIVRISHDEPAWIDNEKSRSLISYQYAFHLKAFQG